MELSKNDWRKFSYSISFRINENYFKNENFYKFWLECLSKFRDKNFGNNLDKNTFAYYSNKDYSISIISNDIFKRKAIVKFEKIER